MTQKRVAPIHPGEILLEEFLKPMGISQYRLARDMSVPARRINEIVHEKRSITADTALRLSRFFGMSEAFWLNLQTHYDLEAAKDKIGARLAKDVLVFETKTPMTLRQVDNEPMSATGGHRMHPSAKAAAYRPAKRR